MSAFAWLTDEQTLEAALTIMLQVTVVLGVTCGIACLIRRNSVARHAICLAGLVLALACPLLVWQSPSFGWSWLRVDWPAEATGSADDEIEPIVADVSKFPAEWEQPATSLPTELPLTSDDHPSVPLESITVPPDVVYRPGDLAPADHSTAEASPAEVVTLPASSAPAMELTETAVTEDASARVAINVRAALGVALIVWFLGVIIQLARWIIARHRLHRLFHGARTTTACGFAEAIADAAAAVGLRQAPRVLSGPLVPIPLVHGVLRPRVLLPQQFLEQAQPTDLRDVLIHEFAHIVRRDAWIALLQRLAAVLYWPHPLLHLLNRQLSGAREEVCDNYVLREGRNSTFAEVLLSLSEQTQPAGVPLGLLGLVARNGRLETRIRGLLDPARRAETRTSGRLVALMAAGGLALLVGVAGIRAGTAVDPADETPATEAEPSDSDPTAVDDSGDETADARVIRGIVEDEQGRPVVGARVRFTAAPFSSAEATTNESGRFELPIPAGQPRRHWALLADSRESAQMGFAEVEDLGRGDPTTRLVLRPARTVSVHVRDEGGAPVAGAQVIVIGRAEYFIGNVGESETGPSGNAAVHYPDGVDVASVMARRDGVGFDYFENGSQRAILHPGPLPQDVQLILDGAQSVAVRVVDSSGAAVGNARVYLSYIHKPGKLDYVNLSGAFSFPVDVDGAVHFGWLPRHFVGAISFSAWSPNAHAPKDAALFPDSQQRQLTTEVFRHARLRGRVLHRDGRPAPEVRVIAFGAPRSPLMRSGRAYSTYSDDEGRYEIEVESNAAYMVSVHDDEWAAGAQSTDVLGEDETAKDLDLTLTPGTVVTGQVTVGDDRTPSADEFVILRQLGERLPKTEDGISRRGLSYGTHTDDEGRFSIRVGPGEYNLVIRQTSLTGREPLRIVGDGERLIFNQHFDAPQWLPLRGRVVNGADGTPLENINIYLGSITDDGGSTRMTPTRVIVISDVDGRFRVDRYRPNNLVYAHSADGSLAGFAIVDHQTSEMTLELHPSVTVVGQLLDHTRQPLADVEVAGYVRSTEVHSHSAAIRTRTDEQGNYRITGVAVGAHFTFVPMRTHFHNRSANPTRIFDQPGEVTLDPVVLPRMAEDDDGEVAATTDDAPSVQQPKDPKLTAEMRQEVLRQIEQSQNQAERSMRLEAAQQLAEDVLSSALSDERARVNAVMLLASLNASSAVDEERPAVPYVPVYSQLLGQIGDKSAALAQRYWAANGLGRICRDADSEVSGGVLLDEERERIATGIMSAIEEQFADPAAIPPTANASTRDGQINVDLVNTSTIAALAESGVSGQFAQRAVDTLVNVTRFEPFTLQVRSTAAKGLGQLSVSSLSDLQARLTAIGRVAGVVGKRSADDPPPQDIRMAAINLYMAFHPESQSETERGWGLFTQAASLDDEQATAEVDRLYRLVLPIVNGIMRPRRLKDAEVQPADLDALSAWLAERGDDASDDGAAAARADDASPRPQSLIEQLTTHCNPWLNTPGEQLRALQYTYTLGNDQRRVELVRGVSQVRQSEWIGATLSTGLHWLLRDPDAFNVMALMLESELNRVQLTVTPESEPDAKRIFLEVGNGISGSWRGYSSHPSDEMTLVVDGDRMLPLRETHKLGDAQQTTVINYGEWEKTADDAWIPKLVTVEHGGAVYRMHFAWQAGAAWLLSHAETEYQGKTNRVAEVTEVVVNDAELIRRTMEQREQRDEAAGVVQAMLDQNRPWLGGEGLSGLESLSYEFLMPQDDMIEQCVIANDGTTVMEVIHHDRKKLSEREGQRQFALASGEWGRSQRGGRFALIDDPADQERGRPFGEQLRHYGRIGCQLDLPIFRYDSLLSGAKVEIEEGEWNGTPCHVATVRSLGRDVYLGCGTMLGSYSTSYVHHIWPAYETIYIDRERNVPLHETLVSSRDSRRFEIDFTDYREIEPGQWAPLAIRVESPEYFTCKLKFQLIEGRHWLLAEVESWFDPETKNRGVVQNVVVNQPSQLREETLKQIEETRFVFGDPPAPAPTVMVPAYEFSLGHRRTIGSLDVLFTLNPAGELVLRCTPAQDQTVAPGEAVSVLLLDESDRMLSAVQATFVEQDGNLEASASFGRSIGLKDAMRYVIARNGDLLDDPAADRRSPAVGSVSFIRRPGTWRANVHARDKSGNTRATGVAIRPGDAGEMAAFVSLASQDRMNEFGLDVSVAIFTRQGELIAAGAKQGTLLVKSSIVEETWEVPLPGLESVADFDRVVVGINRGQTYSAPAGTLWARFVTTYPIFDVETMLAAEDQGCWQVGLSELEERIRDDVLDRGLLDGVRDWKEQVAEHQTHQDVLRPRVERLLSIANQADEPEVLASALRLLGLSGDARAAGTMRAHLEDEDSGLREVAAIALGMLGEADGLPGIESFLYREAPTFESDPDGYRSYRARNDDALIALVNIRTDDSIALIRRLLRESLEKTEPAERDVRHVALLGKLMGCLTDPRYADVLSEVIAQIEAHPSGDRTYDVDELMTSLHEYGEAAREFIARRVRSGDLSALPSRDSYYVTAMREVMLAEGTPPGTIYQGVRYLWNVGTDDAITLLRDTFDQRLPEDRRVRLYVCEVLAYHGDDRGLPIAFEELVAACVPEDPPADADARRTWQRARDNAQEDPLDVFKRARSDSRIVVVGQHLQSDDPATQVACMKVLETLRGAMPDSMRGTLERWNESANEDVATAATLLLQRN